MNDKALSYDPSLIPKFKGQHVSLLKLLNEIEAGAERQQYASLHRKLFTFRRVLEQHLWEENQQLYTYLGYRFAPNPDNAELANDMKQRMLQIGNSVDKFIRHYNEFSVDENSVGTFTTELKAIGEALRERIECEEDSLYSLYLPPKKSA